MRMGVLIRLSSLAIPYSVSGSSSKDFPICSNWRVTAWPLRPCDVVPGSDWSVAISHSGSRTICCVDWMAMCVIFVLQWILIVWAWVVSKTYSFMLFWWKASDVVNNTAGNFCLMAFASWACIDPRHSLAIFLLSISADLLMTNSLYFWNHANSVSVIHVCSPSFPIPINFFGGLNTNDIDVEIRMHC